MRFFYGLGTLIYRYRWAVVLLWVALLLTSAFFAPHLSARLKGGGFGGADMESQRVQSLMNNRFGVSSTTLNVVFVGKNKNLSARSREFQAAEKRALSGVRKMPNVNLVSTYAESKDPHMISKDGKKSYAVVGFDVPEDKAQDMVDEVRAKVRSDELKAYVTGPPAVYLDIVQASNEDVRHAEKFAFPFALVILLVAFGTVIAAGVPVAIGGASVLTAIATLYFISGVYDLSVFVLSIATMLGLGLGIDYALFAVSRFREELESHPVSEAVPRTVSTAGRSIFFSGSTVLIGLSGLLFFPFMFMRSMGLAGVVVVFISVLAALTLLPATLGILGHRINALSIRRSRGAPGVGFWGRSASFVMGHPILVLVGVAGILSTLLYPVGHMKLGLPAASALPKKYESRAGDDILKKDFDYASLNPVQIVATTSARPISAEGLADIKKLDEQIESTGDVTGVQSVYTIGEKGAKAYAKRVEAARSKARADAKKRVDEIVRKKTSRIKSRYGYVPPGTEERIRSAANKQVEQNLKERLPTLPKGISANGKVTPEGVANFLKLPEARKSKKIQSAIDTNVAGDRTLLQATTEADPYSERARAAVGDIRAIKPPEGMSILVGGLSAGQKDFITSLYGKAPYAAAFVLGVTFVILFLTFRSIFLPLKAVIVNILSLTASFGAMVFVFQDGHFSNLLNFTPLGFVDATLPILMFCTVFGVSMDYEVFLLSRIREAYESGDSNTASVAKGLTSTAGIITSAAAIVIVVTGAFAFTGIILTKAVGLGLAVAVFVDATIIRILLVPAAMRILGDWNWWPAGRRKVFRSGDKINS